MKKTYQIVEISVLYVDGRDVLCGSNDLPLDPMDDEGFFRTNPNRCI